MQRTFQAMTRQFTFLSLALALTASLSACPSSVPLMPGQGQQQSSFGNLNGQTAVPDEYLIKRKGSAYLQDPMQFAQQYGLLFVREIEPLGVELFKVTSPAALEQVRAMAEYIEPNYLRYLSMPAQQAQALRAASVFQRQNAEAGAALPVNNNYIGIIDTGVDTAHPDLQGKLIAGHNTLGQATVHDDNGHGTYLAGVAVGQNPGQDLNGVLPGGKVLPIKALDSNGIGTDFSVADGIVRAVEYGAQVIVLSATGANQSQALQAALDYANQRNIPVVAPAGNQMDAKSVFPGNSRSVLAVNSVDASGQGLSAFSRPANNVTISAVGEGIRSTLPMNGFSLSRLGVSAGYGQLQTPGTAAVQVAAAVAAIKALNPGIRLPEIRQQLMAAADPMQAPGQMGQINQMNAFGQPAASVSPQFGSGRLNMARIGAMAMQRAGAPAYAYATAPQQAMYAPQQAAFQQQTAYGQPRRGF